MAMLAEAVRNGDVAKRGCRRKLRHSRNNKAATLRRRGSFTEQRANFAGERVFQKGTDMQFTNILNGCKDSLSDYLKRLRTRSQSKELRQGQCTRCDASLVVLRANFQRLEDHATQTVALCPKCANAFQNWYTAGRYAVV